MCLKWQLRFTWKLFGGPKNLWVLQEWIESGAIQFPEADLLALGGQTLVLREGHTLLLFLTGFSTLVSSWSLWRKLPHGARHSGCEAAVRGCAGVLGAPRLLWSALQGVYWAQKCR